MELSMESQLQNPAFRNNPQNCQPCIQVDERWRPEVQDDMEEMDEERLPEWKLTAVQAQERNTWRLAVRYAMHAASQLPEGGPTDVDDAPAPASKI